MRFTIVTYPGSDAAEARSRASQIVRVDDPDALAAAARTSDDPYLLVLGEGARPLSGALGGLTASCTPRVGVLGGTTVSGALRHFGWMLAPVPIGPLPFELTPIAAPLGEAGIDVRVRGPIDVVAPGMNLVARELLLEPLPRDPLAALVELCARARAAGREVICRPSFACASPPLDADDRGRAASLRTLAECRPELVGAHRLTAGMRSTTVEREIRLQAGRRVRARVAHPPMTILVHGPGAELAARRARELGPTVVAARAVDDAATALRAEMQIRGDRYVLVVDAERMPRRAAFDNLVEAIEASPFVALAAPDASSLDGDCVLIALGKFPQHIEAAGATLRDALATLVRAAGALRRAVRAPGHRTTLPTAPAPRSATIVFLASSAPEVARMTLADVVASSRGDDEIVAVTAANAHTVQRIVAAYPQVRLEPDAADPLLTDGANRAIAGASRDLVLLVADDVLVPAGALDRLRDAFARVPALGAAFPLVPGAVGDERIVDVQYADIAALRVIAGRRMRERAREVEPIGFAVSPVLAVAREALAAVGGIDRAHGPTRRGIAGLVARLRAAGYGVVRCEDALVHRFEPAVSQNPAAVAGAQQSVVAPDAVAFARGFDPARGVPFVRPSAAGSAAIPSHAIALAVAEAAELERGACFLAAAARSFDASAPVRVHILLDGEIAPAEVVARIRPALASSGRTMEEAIAVRVERAPNLGAWRVALGSDIRIVVAAGHERDAFDDLTAVAADDLHDLLVAAAR